MLKAIPTTAHLARLYYELSQIGASATGAKRPWPYHPRGPAELFCLAAEMSRYDPRLMTILVRFLEQKWHRLNPAAIRRLYPQMHSPQSVTVIAEFVLGDKPKDETRFFCDYLQQGLKPSPTQFYFNHLYAPGSYLALQALLFPLSEYKKWGFLAREAPVVDEEHRASLGNYDSPVRINILQNLLLEKKKIRLSDYLAACGGHISRQQAFLDLKNVKGIKTSGHGKSARWVR